MLYEGEKYGYWTVLYRDTEREREFHRIHGYYCSQHYVCECVCGTIKSIAGPALKSGTSKSCGCKNGRNLKDRQFGHLHVLHISKSYKSGSGKHRYWTCECDLCGNIVDVRGSDLRSGQKTDCGCESGKRMSVSQANDLSGLQFGYLHVLERDFSTSGGSGNHAKWFCKCDLCGNVSSVSGTSLTRDGKDRCSKCIGLPLGEAKISEVLDNSGIPYDHDTHYKDCIYPETGYKLRFDFVVHADEDYIIEYDGEQHFKIVPQWEGTMTLEERKLRDEYKNKWCMEHNIKLIRIPYTHLKDICEEDTDPNRSAFLLSAS